MGVAHLTLWTSYSNTKEILGLLGICCSGQELTQLFHRPFAMKSTEFCVQHYSAGTAIQNLCDKFPSSAIAPKEFLKRAV